MKVKHKVTGEIHELITDTYWSGSFSEHSICARTNLDLMKQNDRERYDELIVRQRIQVTVHYIQEPATDFEELTGEHRERV